MTTEDVLPGMLGKIETPKNAFIRCRRRSFGLIPRRARLTINPRTKIVRLNTRLRLRKAISNFGKLTTTCGNLRFGGITINLFVFRKKYGDSFLTSCSSELNNIIKENKKFDRKQGMATSLHRMMRMVFKEKNPETFNEIMASAKVNTELNEAINRIVKKHIVQSSGDHPSLY